MAEGAGSGDDSNADRWMQLSDVTEMASWPGCNSFIPIRPRMSVCPFIQSAPLLLLLYIFSTVYMSNLCFLFPPLHPLPISIMGNCFSSSTATQLASTALNLASTHLSPTPTPTSPRVKEIIEHCVVTKIPDGDTFTCNPPSRSPLRVRVMGIDTPETKQNYGPEAGNIAREMLDGKQVTLHVHTTDRYGRVVADVVVDGTNFGMEMLKKGAAWHYKQYDKREEYAQLETEAREDGRGLWQWPRPTPPWDYRRRIRERN